LLWRLASERRGGGHQRSSVGFGSLNSSFNQGPKMTDEMMNLQALMEKSADIFRNYCFDALKHRRYV
jgi:hypothetical protein